MIKCNSALANEKIPSKRRMPAKIKQQCGAAALEYILVSTFAAVVTVAALGFVSKVIKDELTTMASKLGISEVPDITNPLAP